MTVTEIITQVLDYTDDIPSTDADYEARRSRLLNYLLEVVAELWYASEWSFARRTAQLTVTASSGQATVPADFLRLGDYGDVRLIVPQTARALENVPEYRIIAIRNTAFRTQTPTEFSIFDLDDTKDPPLPIIQLPLNDSEYDILLNYIKRAPDLDEGSNNTNLVEIPIEYHQRVLVPGLQARTLQSKGDATWNSYQGRFVEGIAEMKIQLRRRQGTVQQLPSFFGR